MRLSPGLIAFGACVALGVGMTTAVAQQYGAPQGAPAAGQYAPRQSAGAPGMALQAAQPSAQTLARFKQAFRSVAAISKVYSAKIEQAHDPKVAQALQRQAEVRMVAAVKASGMSVQQYDRVMSLLQHDPALRQQVIGAGH